MNTTRPKRRRPRRYDTRPLAVAAAARGLTDQTLAATTRLSPATIGRVLTGRTKRPSTIAAVAAALDIDLADLVAPALNGARR